MIEVPALDKPVPLGGVGGVVYVDGYDLAEEVHCRSPLLALPHA